MEKRKRSNERKGVWGSNKENREKARKREDVEMKNVRLWMKERRKGRNKRQTKERVEQAKGKER